MSPVFVKEFLSKNKCLHCPQAAANGRTMCRKHRTVVNDAWLIWSHHRRESGLCVNCADGKEVLTKDGRHTGRCKTHRAMNSTKCSAWARNSDNYKRAKRDNKDRTAKWRAIGRCANCVEHNPLEEDCVKCSSCHELAKARTNGDAATVQRFLKEKNRVRLWSRLEAIKGARQRLKNLGYEPPTPAWAREKTSKLRRAA